MTHPKSAASLFLLVLLGASSPRAMAEGVKPLALILLDTSGSMEYESGITTDGVEFVVPLCEGPGATSPTLNKPGKYPQSRLMAAKEVLTGTVRAAWCRYDYRQNSSLEDFGYPIPHSQACSKVGGTCGHPSRKPNGLLDIRRDDFKFAFMSFDSLESSHVGAPGMWSYGATTPVGINLGARNNNWGQPNHPNVWSAGKWIYSDVNRSVNNRGQLIGAATSENQGKNRAQNRLIQYEINSTVGYWGTPLAPLLADARTFLETDPSVAPATASGQGDPFASCRDRVVILITDGRASQGEGVGGYTSTKSALYALKNTAPTPVRVYVVGFNMANQDASVISGLDPAFGGPADGVYIVDSPSQLAVALSEIFNTVLAGTESRTTVAYTNATRTSLDQQYQYNAAYSPDPNYPLNHLGYLDQTTYRCSESCADTTDGAQSCSQELLSLQTSLNARPSEGRQVWASIYGEKRQFNAEIVGLAASPKDMRSLFGVPGSGTLPRVAPAGFNGIVPIPPNGDLGPASSFAVQQSYMHQLVPFMRADDWTLRHQARLGAITHATPQLQEQALAGRHPLPSWNTHVQSVGSEGYAPQCRPTMLYTGTHDGQIHAFRVDRLQSLSGDCAEQAVPPVADEERGSERWSLIPQHLLKQGHELFSTGKKLMDGQLVVQDVLMERGDPTLSDDELEAAAWRSVLTAGYGQGGRGYIALDVTQPMDIDSVQIQWEIDATSRCKDGQCTSFENGFGSDFSLLGLTVAKPAYGTAFLNAKEVAIAILPGGDASDDPTRPDEGRVVYIVRLDTGEKIAEFSNNMGNIRTLGGGSFELLAPMTGSPAAYPNLPAAVTTRVFLGDAGGRLWRINMENASPSAWTMHLFHDPYDGQSPFPSPNESNRQPVMGTPKLALDGPYGHLAVVYGTGSVDYSSSELSRSLVVSVSEQTAINGSVDLAVNWFKVFDANEKLTGEPEVFASAAYFTTHVTNTSSQCDAATGRLYGVHYVDAAEEGDSLDTTVAALDEDGDPLTLSKVTFISTGASVPYGVQVIERPACMPGGSVADGVQGQAQLVLNIAQGGTSDSSSLPPGTNPATVGTQTLTHPVVGTTATMDAAGWGYVLY